MSNLTLGGKKVKEMDIVGKKVSKITLNGKTFEFNNTPNPYRKTEVMMSDFKDSYLVRKNYYTFKNTFTAMEDDTFADNESNIYTSNGYTYKSRITKAYSDHNKLNQEMITIRDGVDFIKKGGHFLLSTIGLGFIPVHESSRQSGKWIFDNTIKKTNTSFDQTDLKINTLEGEVHKVFSDAECGYIKWREFAGDISISLEVYVKDSGGEQGLAGYFNATSLSKMVIEGFK